MHLKNQFYTIQADVKTMPSLEKYDYIFDFNHRGAPDYYMAKIFHITGQDGFVRSLALMDQVCASYKPFAVLEEHILTVILFDTICQIDLRNYDIVRTVHCDNMGGLHEIHKLDCGYFLWGEGDLFRYDMKLNRIWQFMGKDILVSEKYRKSFWIESDIIHCRDFLGWHYILNLDGDMIENYQEV